jgi:predicted class III extradiol MEMO1 family dioxygenase
MSPASWFTFVAAEPYLLLPFRPAAGRGTGARCRVGVLESILDKCEAASALRTGPHLFQGALGYVVPHAGPAYSGTVAAAV